MIFFSSISNSFGSAVKTLIKPQRDLSRFTSMVKFLIVKRTITIEISLSMALMFKLMDGSFLLDETKLNYVR